MKRAAKTTIVGLQGHPVVYSGPKAGVIGGTSRAEMTPESRALLASADTLEDTMHSAACRETQLAQICSSDEEMADRRALESFRQSRMMLEVYGYLGQGYLEIRVPRG